MTSLEQALVDSTSSVFERRIAAIPVLEWHLGHPIASPAIIALLDDPDTAVIEDATCALFRWQDDEGLLAVLSAAASADDDVAQAILDALSRDLELAAATLIRIQHLLSVGVPADIETAARELLSGFPH